MHMVSMRVRVQPASHGGHYDQYSPFQSAMCKRWDTPEISLDELVAWANVAMMEADFVEAYYDAIRDAVARLGLADVQAFGLTWEDCTSILKRLGYDVR